MNGYELWKKILMSDEFLIVKKTKKPVCFISDMNIEGIDSGNDDNITEDHEKEVFEAVDRMLGEESDRKKEADTKPSINLSGSQNKRRVKCKLLAEQKMILGYEVSGKKVIPLLKPGQTEQEVELMITGMKLHKKPINTEQTPMAKRPRPQNTPSTTEKKNTAPKRQRKFHEDAEEPGEFEVIITYSDDHSEKVALDAYHLICNELANNVRSILLGQYPIAFQSKGIRKTSDGRVIVRTQDIVSRDIIMKAVDGITWTGPSGAKNFRAWRSSEAPAPQFKGPWIKYKVYIPGPKRDFEEIANTFGAQNQIVKMLTSKWKSFTYYSKEEGNNYNDSHLLVIGVDHETAEILKTRDYKLHFNLWYITFKELDR